jgi:hypothetical protein
VSSIVNKFSRRILLYPVVAVLSGAVALSAGLARGPARDQSHARNARGTVHHATPDSAKKGEANIPIGVQHGGANDHDNAAAALKRFKIVPSNHAHVFATKPSAGLPIVGRNAIGVPMVRREVVTPDATLPFNHFQTPPPGSPAGGVGSFAHGNPATTQFVVPRPNLPPANLSGGRIDGASLIRHPAAGVGGPSIPMGGINGTAFVRKR